MSELLIYVILGSARSPVLSEMKFGASFFTIIMFQAVQSMHLMNYVFVFHSCY